MSEHPTRKPWFAAKRYGYGAGLPIAWEGWVVLGLFLALAVGGVFLLPPAIHIALVLAVTPPFVLIVYRRTEGGWHWRWG